MHEGDPEVIRGFVELHYPGLYRLLLRLTEHVEEAEDLAQQTFVKARRHAGSYGGRASLKTWLFKIAIHEYTHWKRKQGRTRSLADAAIACEGGQAASVDAIVVGEALARLPAAQREAFLLLELQEMSIAEVAATLGIPVGTAKSRVHYARLALRARLQHGTEEYRHDELVFES